MALDASLLCYSIQIVRGSHHVGIRSIQAQLYGPKMVVLTGIHRTTFLSLNTLLLTISFLLIFIYKLQTSTFHWRVHSAHPLSSLPPFFVHSPLRSFACSFANSFVYSFVRSFLLFSSLYSFVRSFVRCFVRWFFRSLIRSFVTSFIRSQNHSFIHSYVRSFYFRFCIRSFALSFTPSFVRSFTLSFIHALACWLVR